ncbi:MAG: rod shape-determining protein [Oscillospiraceae bacterium]|nr:rod shape-determining protein [Oscillospiraceae bacterium]
MLGINIGIDLGTTSVIAYQEGKGIVLSEPSVVAFRKPAGKMIAVGKAAYKMIGRESRSVVVVRPMRDGVVSNFSVTEQLLRYVIMQICGSEIFKPNIIVSMPGTVTNLEKRTILDVITSSGAGRACLLEEPLAAAVGAGIDTLQPNGVLVVDLGGGTTDVAVITMGSMAVATSIRVAGNALNDSIYKYCKRERGVVIGEQTAEEIKTTIGGAVRRENQIAMMAKGKDYISGMPVEFEIDSDEVYYAIRENIRSILNAVHEVLERTPPELASDIMEEGILLTGGTALLFGMEEAVYASTGIKTRIADDPVNCVANGIGSVLSNMDSLENSGYLFLSREEIPGVTNGEEEEI